MGTQFLAQSEMIAPQEVKQIEVIDVAEQVRYGEQSSIRSIIIIRWLSIFFCLAFWYGVYKVLTLFIS
jgi:hypothetical protein